MLHVLLTNNSKIQFVFCGTASSPEYCFFFSYVLLCLWFQSVQDDFQHDFPGVTDWQGLLFSRSGTVPFWTKGMANDYVIRWAICLFAIFCCRLIAVHQNNSHPWPAQVLLVHKQHHMPSFLMDLDCCLHFFSKNPLMLLKDDFIIQDLKLFYGCTL